MSDKLTLSAALSVLMMTTYALFGGHAESGSTGIAPLESPMLAAAPALPSLKVVLAQTGTRRILY